MLASNLTTWMSKHGKVNMITNKKNVAMAMQTCIVIFGTILKNKDEG
jgi:hypothetical protein